METNEQLKHTFDNQIIPSIRKKLDSDQNNEQLLKVLPIINLNNFINFPNLCNKLINSPDMFDKINLHSIKLYKVGSNKDVVQIRYHLNQKKFNKLKLMGIMLPLKFEKHIYSIKYYVDNEELNNCQILDKEFYPIGDDPLDLSFANNHKITCRINLKQNYTTINKVDYDFPEIMGFYKIKDKEHIRMIKINNNTSLKYYFDSKNIKKIKYPFDYMNMYKLIIVRG